MAFGVAVAILNFIHIDFVENDRYVLLKDIKDTYVLRSDHDKQIEALTKSLAERNGEVRALNECPENLQVWKKSHADWMQATQTCRTDYNQCASNCSLLTESRRLENQLSYVKHDIDRLGTGGMNGNPPGDVSKSNLILLEAAKRDAADLNVRILELTKRLNPAR